MVCTRNSGAGPEQILLHQVLAENLETFLDRCQSAEHELLRYVEKELRDYLSCGVLGHGSLRLAKLQP